ncbi:MAG: response regulator transcription factor [Chlorobi bacterium]|nr:response regulator transcription factor [Chlorobiota bacterium]
MENKLKCYIVDDQLNSVERMEFMLEKCQDVEIAGSSTNPSDAILEILLIKPDVVFLDIEMPGLTGFELIEKIRLHHLFPKFIFVTGYSQYAIKAIKTRAFDYLLKPIDLDELKLSIHRIVLKDDMEDLIQQLKLSNREREIIELIIKGFSSQEISEKLFISINTVNTHRRNLLEKNNFKNTKELLLALTSRKQ